MIDMLKKIVNDGRTAFLHGKAFKRIEKENYKGAANILEKICHENTNDQNSEYVFYCLGLCHFQLGNLITAREWLTKSYDLYKKNIITDTSIRYRRWFRDLAELYCKVLRIDGSDDLADQIINDLDFGS